ncbi:LysR family transcriptional regulator [Candidatus Saganbacteria bacterium]|nr:LysR family transcriptional regulator [Candidatus Saganbacteria bacterium]
MHIEDCKIWLDLVDTQSFSRCAELNFLTQPAISQKIKQLEKEFGAPLFMRRGKSFHLTAAGKLLQEESRKIFNGYQNLFSRINAMAGTVQGILKIATIYSIGLYELSDVIKKIIEKYPLVRLDIDFSHAAKIYQDLLDEKIDIGVVSYPKERGNVKKIIFHQDDLILVTHPKHPFAKVKKINIRKLNGLDFIGFEETVPTAQAIRDIFEKYNVQVKTKMAFDNIELIKRAIEINAGVSILPSITVKHEIEHRLLKGIGFANQRFLRPLGIITKKDRPLTTAAQKFIAELKTQVN